MVGPNDRLLPGQPYSTWKKREGPAVRGVDFLVSNQSVGPKNRMPRPFHASKAPVTSHQ